MRNTLGLVLVVLSLLTMAGCQEGRIFTVDFMSGQTLEYKIVSDRTVTLDITGDSVQDKKGKSQAMTEKMELVMEYQQAGVEDGFGRTLIKATCKSAKVQRRSFTGKSTPADSVEKLAGKSFTLKISATGNIEDYSDLERLIQETAASSLGPEKNGAKLKNPDMIADFAASQWYLWNSTSTIKNPSRGASIGQSWSTDQVVPMPIPLNIVKKATYTLTDIEATDTGQIAHFDSVFQIGNRSIKHWDDPYQQKYYMKGMFAFLKGYELLSLDGTGTQTFNLDKGYIQNEKQHYTSVYKVAFPMALGDTVPTLIVDQKYTLELLSNK